MHERSKVQSYQAEVITVKYLIQRRNNVTSVRVEPTSCDRSRCKNDTFTLLDHAANSLGLKNSLCDSESFMTQVCFELATR